MRLLIRLIAILFIVLIDINTLLVHCSSTNVTNATNSTLPVDGRQGYVIFGDDVQSYFTDVVSDIRYMVNTNMPGNQKSNKHDKLMKKKLKKFKPTKKCTTTTTTTTTPRPTRLPPATMCITCRLPLRHEFQDYRPIILTTTKAPVITTTLPPIPKYSNSHKRGTNIIKPLGPSIILIGNRGTVNSGQQGSGSNIAHIGDRLRQGILAAAGQTSSNTASSNPQNSGDGSPANPGISIQTPSGSVGPATSSPINIQIPPGTFSAAGQLGGQGGGATAQSGNAPIPVAGLFTSDAQGGGSFVGQLDGASSGHPPPVITGGTSGFVNGTGTVGGGMVGEGDNGNAVGVPSNLGTLPNQPSSGPVNTGSKPSETVTSSSNVRSPSGGGLSGGLPGPNVLSASSGGGGLTTGGQFNGR